jgi:hypothetical protein
MSFGGGINFLKYTMGMFRLYMFDNQEFNYYFSVYCKNNYNKLKFSQAFFIDKIQAITAFNKTIQPFVQKNPKTLEIYLKTSDGLDKLEDFSKIAIKFNELSKELEWGNFYINCCKFLYENNQLGFAILQDQCLSATSSIEESINTAISIATILDDEYV